MKRYDDEFKKNAVTMLMMSQKPLRQVADELGVSDTSLENWKREYMKEIDRHPRGDGVPTPSDLVEEIKRLKKELIHVTWQRDILKKAASILSERSQGGMQ